MKVFLTGATGFIGNYLIKELIDAGYDVIFLSRYRKEKFYDDNSKVIQINKDISMLTPNDLKDVSVIIHLACAGVSPKKASFQEILKVNVEASAHLMNIGKLSKVDKYIYAGTCHEYGLSCNDYKFIPANASLLPLTLYASSKVSGFLFANSIAKIEGLKLIYARIFTAYGKGQNIKNFWPSLRKAALSGENFLMTQGRQIRDFIHASSVAKDLLNLISYNGVKNGEPLVLNIGSGQELSLADFAKREWFNLNAKGRIIFGAIEERINEPVRIVPELDDILNIRRIFK